METGPVSASPLTLAYRAGLWLDRKFTRAVRLPAPVISVGNIASGGRGKTPFVILLARGLKERGFRPVVLTRGYGRSRGAPRSVELAPPFAQAPSAALAGDEALEIAASAGVEVLVGAQRARHARRWLARETERGVVFLLDDGFQHWKLARDFDLVLTDDRDFADQLLPAGRLRETPRALARASLELRRGRDFTKRTELVASPPTGEPVGFLTTRAPDPAYEQELAQFFGRRPLEALELADHAPVDAVWRALSGARARHWVVGAKEAVKILPPGALERFFAEGQHKMTFQGRSVSFYFARCHVELAQADILWPRIDGLLAQKGWRPA